jgi:DNA repair protein RadC
MNLPLFKQDLNGSEDPITAHENEIIQQASQILDRRLFTQEATLETVADVASYLKLKLAAEEHEVFGVIFLNAKHRPLAFEVLFTGTIDTATIHPRQIIKRALAHNAAAIIICHNHPSGSCNPSEGDIAMTRRVKDAVRLLDIRLLDHFLVGCGEPMSFLESGLI